MKTTTDPHLTQINLFYKKDFYGNASNYLAAIQGYSKELETSIKYLQSYVANDPVTSASEVFVQLDEQMKSMSPQFAAFWLQKYNQAHEKIKNEVGLKIGTGTFYRPFSDSIGIITRQENLYDESVQSVLNKSFPMRYGSTLSNKIHPQRLLLHGEMSNKLNKLFNQNLQNIQEKGAIPTKAHGENLVPDTEHVKRIQQIVSNLNQRIKNEFKQLYNVIGYYCQYNAQSGAQNIQFIPNYNISVNIEGTPINQDILFNQLQEVQKDITTSKVLGLT